MTDFPDLDDGVPADEEPSIGSLTRADLLRRAAVGGAVIAVPSFASSAVAAVERIDAPVRGGVLRMARNEEAQSFDPIVPGDNGSIYSIQQIFDQLTRINSSSSYIAPG